MEKLKPLFLPANLTTDTPNQIKWRLSSLDIPELWKLTKGEGIKVAVLDSGIAFNHPDFIEGIVEMRDFTQSNASVYDIRGHGTHVAGIIASKNPDIGIAPSCKLLIGKVINDKGFGEAKQLAEAILWAADNEVQIINISIVTRNNFPELEEAIKYAFSKNCSLICSAGSSGPDKNSINFPAAYKETIAVGAVDEESKLVFNSSQGSEIDVVAPGSNVTSTAIPNGYISKSGTSMAAPFVSGIVALMLSKHLNREFKHNTPINNSEDVREHLMKTAIDLEPRGFDSFFGWGLINPINFFN